jgi:glycosyltransferase involved in cell wall biosynthesis
LRVALDATYSTGLKLSGIGVYSREVLQGLAAAHAETSFSWCYRMHRFREGLIGNRPANVRVRPLFESFPSFRADLFHGLNQRMPARRFRRTVCTFHDLFFLTSEYSTPEFRQRFAEQAKAAAGRADLVICVSDFTAKQANALLGVEAARLRVIPHGTRFPPGEKAAEREAVILNVGTIQLRKNIARLVEAFERAAPPPWRLILAGEPAGYGAEEILVRIADSPARDRIEVTGWVDDETLQHLYRKASIFAFPSLDEGFGIPVLEAMAHGLPVLSSNRSALPEVCGDACLLVNPMDSDEVAGGLSRLVEDSELRRRLAAASLARAPEFTWERAVDSTWKVYEELCGEPVSV